MKLSFLLQVSHNLFWHRYYYKTHKLKIAEEKRQAMKQRMETNNDDDDNTIWDEGICTILENFPALTIYFDFLTRTLVAQMKFQY